MIQKLRKLNFLLFLFFTIASIILGLIFFKYPHLTIDNLGLEKSTAEISVEGDDLKIKFNVIPSDQVKIKKFSENLGISEEWINGLQISLNDDIIEEAKKITPSRVTLDIEEKQIKVKSSLLSGLQSGLPDKSVNYSTGSARLVLEGNNSQDFSIEATNPHGLLVDATSSGKLMASPKLNKLFELSTRIDKIELKVHNKNINGQINLK